MYLVPDNPAMDGDRTVVCLWNGIRNLCLKDEKDVRVMYSCIVCLDFGLRELVRVPLQFNIFSLTLTKSWLSAPRESRA